MQSTNALDINAVRSLDAALLFLWLEQFGFLNIFNKAQRISMRRAQRALRILPASGAQRCFRRNMR
jgi:hypothetical protein